MPEQQLLWLQDVERLNSSLRWKRTPSKDNRFGTTLKSFSALGCG
jgi:hypothetical protein